MPGTIEPLGLHEVTNVGRGSQNRIRINHGSAQVVSMDGSGRYGEGALKARVFHAVSPTLTLAASGGNLVGSTAGQNTNTCLFNPVNSNYHLVLLRVALSVNSGTFAAGGAYHGVQTSQTIATSLAGAAQGVSGLVGSAAKSAGWVFTQGTQAALTGGGATTQLGPIAGTTATAAANAYLLPLVEELNGSIVLPPGTAYQPLFTGVGTTVIYNMGYTWYELPSAYV